MKAMIVNSFGGVDVFELAEVSKPSVKPGHVLVNIKATSVNTVDTMIRQMGPELPLSPAAPAILGMDFAGIVEAVGEDVTDFSIGDEVYGCAGGLADLPGTLAEYIVADSDLIAHKPRSLSMQQSAAIPLVGITAFEGLQRANIKKDQKVLVHGGAGGVGHIALQLAKYYGADVYSTGGTQESLALIARLGATPIHYQNESVGEYVGQYTNDKGFDLVFDSVGGANMTNSFEAAALNAHIVSTVALVDIDLSPAHFKGLSLHVVFMLLPMLHNVGRKQHRLILEELAKIIDAKHLSPILDKQSYTLEEVAQAHARLESGEAIGKVVISI